MVGEKGTTPPAHNCERGGCVWLVVVGGGERKPPSLANASEGVAVVVRLDAVVLVGCRRPVTCCGPCSGDVSF